MLFVPKSDQMAIHFSCLEMWKCLMIEKHFFNNQKFGFSQEVSGALNV